MEETGAESKEVPNTSTTASSTPSTTIQQTTTTTSPNVCKVCGSPSQYSYYGAIVCASCKVFFRRNARTQSVPLTCNYGNNCEIDINSRQICRACRLAKCFAIGMSAALIRPPRVATPKNPEKKKSTNNPASSTATTDSTSSIKRTSSASPISTPMLPTLNLLRADQSTLSVEQWNDLSNLVHCFDDYSGLSSIHCFVDKQTTLPPKFRFKYESVKTFFTSMMAQVQLVFEKNRDIFALSLHDRTTLLHSTVEYTTGIGAAFILQQAQLFDHPAFFMSTELMFKPAAVAIIKRLIDHLDPDIIFMKIIFSILAFLISNYTFYAYIAPTNLTDVKEILRIQDMYTELVWRYLLYKHSHREAVLCFTNFIRFLFLLCDSVVEAHETQQFTDIIASVVESTEQNLTLNT